MIWWPDRPDAVRIDSGWNCTAHRPARASSIAITTSSTPAGEPSDAVTRNPGCTSAARAYRLWYRPAMNSPAGRQQRSPRHPDQPRLAVRGFGQQGQLSPGVLHHGLQAQADTEDGQVPRVQLIEQGRAAEVGGPSRPG